MTRLDLTRPQILAFRRQAGALWTPRVWPGGLLVSGELAGTDRDAVLTAAAAARERRAPWVPGFCELPRGVADFTARASEMAILQKISTAEDQSGPVVLIAGPPGTGKTTLAIRTAEVLGATFRDGCFFVDLRGLSDQPVGPGEVASRLLRALGVAERKVPADAADLLAAIVGPRATADRAAIAEVGQDGPTIVAGHSDGGQIMTALGTDAPNVAGLVYVAAFGIDQGESIGGLLSSGPVTPALEHMITDQHGFGWLTEDDFVNHFAGDIEPATARVMHAVQQPLALSGFAAVMGVPAWKSVPTWYLVAGQDEAIPPDAERQFASRMGAATVEIASGHVAMVSHPDAVAELIRTAAASVAA